MGKKFLREYSDEEYCDGLDTSAYDYSDAFYDEIMDNIHSRDKYEDLMGERMPEEEIKRRIDNDDFVRNNIYESVREALKEYGEGHASQYQLGRLAARKANNGDLKGRDEVCSYAHNARKKSAGNDWNKEVSLANSNANGFHVGNDNAASGYEQMKMRDNYYKNISENRKKYSAMKITESQLRQIIRESVVTIMNEGLKDKAKKFWNKCQQFCDDEPVQKKRGTIGDAEGAEGNLTQAKNKIKSMVKEAISELSRDAMDASADAARAYLERSDCPGTPEWKKREEQYHTFINGVNKTVGDNPRAQLRLAQERKARRNGTRTYKDGKWTYNDAQR